MLLDFASAAICSGHRLSVMARACLSGRHPRSAVFLMFHSVGGLADAPYIVESGTASTPVESFREILTFFLRRGFRTLTVSEYARRQVAGTLEPGILVLTFDDGFADNYLLAAPVLRELGMTATFYPVCGWVGRRSPAWLHRAAFYATVATEHFVEAVRAAAGEHWPAFFSCFRSTGEPSRDASLVFRQALHPARQRQVLCDLAAAHGSPPTASLYMSWEELARLQRWGMEIGAHTMTHRSLWTLPPALAAREILHSKQVLERRLGSAVTSFAYPYGHLLPAHLKVLTESGFLAAVTTREHGNDPSEQRFELGRYGVGSNPLSRYELNRMALDATPDPVAWVNRRLGRHLGHSLLDPEAGLITVTAAGLAYDPAPGAILLNGGV